MLSRSRIGSIIDESAVALDKKALWSSRKSVYLSKVCRRFVRTGIRFEFKLD